jgi:MinD superfamily P-loop ATPase
MNICEIAFLSVKGGSGKSTLVLSFVMWLNAQKKKPYILDTCLNNPVIEHFLDYKTIEQFDHTGSSIACIDCDLCIHCDECRMHCTFEAVVNKDQFFVKPDVCTGCNMCVSVCPVEAIKMIPKRTGQWKISDTTYGEMIHGWAIKDSPKLIQIMKKEAIFRAIKDEYDYLITNSTAGISLDTKIAVENADKRIAIVDSNVRSKVYINALDNFATENNFTLHIVLNNTGLTPEIDDSLRHYIIEKKMLILGELPFSREIARCNSMGVVPYTHNKDLDDLMESIFQRIIDL